MEPISGNSGRTRHKLITLALSAALLGLLNLATDTSCTAPPHCPAGQHAQRAPSHQGHMWDCVPDQGQS